MAQEVMCRIMTSDSRILWVYAFICANLRPINK